MVIVVTNCDLFLLQMEEAKEKEKQPTILSSSNANTDASANDISSLVRYGGFNDKNNLKCGINYAYLLCSAYFRKKRAHDESEAEADPKRSKSEEIAEKGEENIAV